MAESIRRQIIRRCRLATERLKQTEEALAQIDQMHHGRSETISHMAPVILRATELLLELWEKMRLSI